MQKRFNVDVPVTDKRTVAFFEYDSFTKDMHISLDSNYLTRQDFSEFVAQANEALAYMYDQESKLEYGTQVRVIKCIWGDPEHEGTIGTYVGPATDWQSKSAYEVKLASEKSMVCHATSVERI